MTDFITISGKDFEIRRNQRRTKISVGVDSFGKYFIGCPSSYSERQIITVIENNSKTLIRTIERNRFNPIKSHFYEEGEKFLFRGIEYPLSWTEESKLAPLELRNNIFFIFSGIKGREYDIFEAWYKRALYEEIQNILHYWTVKIHVNPRTINVKTVKSVWGSCSAKGNITFSTRLALVPPELLEYVIVHELCHILHMNHSPDFWAEVKKHIDNFKEKRNLLRSFGISCKWW